MKWSIEDGNGKVHNIVLPGTYYFQQAKKKLLSPQHWVQQAGDDHPMRNGTCCATYANKIKLHWDQQSYTCAIPLHPKSNVGVLCTAPMIAKCCNACLHIEKDAHIVAMPMILETFTHYEHYGILR